MEVVLDDRKFKRIRSPVSKGHESHVSLLAAFNMSEKFVSFSVRAAVLLHESAEFFLRKMSIFASSSLEHMNSFLYRRVGKEAVEFGEGDMTVTVRDFMVEIINLSLGHGVPAGISNC